MSYLDNLKKRLGSLGGNVQIDRMNKDKLKSLKRAIDYSYQSATITNESGNSFKCLMNPNKLSNDYDIKIISIPYKDYNLNGDHLKEIDTELKVGKTFRWDDNDSYWIVCLQKLEETAYFRAEVRRCRFSIEINGKRYWIYLRGPIENSILWSRSGFDYFNKLNETAFMYIERNEDTLAFFQRFAKLKLGDQWWEVQATDKISSEGIIEVALKEDFTNKFNNLEENYSEIIKEDEKTEPYIKGAAVVKPYSLLSYSLVGIEGGGVWSISDLTRARIKSTTDTGVIVEVITGKSGEFTLSYQKDQSNLELFIKILSL